MADYDPNIPAANDLISESQVDIQNNFSQLNTIFGADHETWNTTTSAWRGKHKKMTFPEVQPSDPALGSDYGILFPKDDPNDSTVAVRAQLYWKNNTETLQLTNRFHDASSSGYIMLSGGIILMWMSASVGLIGTQGFSTINFPAIANYAYQGGQTFGFPNNFIKGFTQIVSGSTTKELLVYQDSITPPTKEYYSVNIRSSIISDTINFTVFAIGN